MRCLLHDGALHTVKTNETLHQLIILCGLLLVHQPVGVRLNSDIHNDVSDSNKQYRLADVVEKISKHIPAVSNAFVVVED